MFFLMNKFWLLYCYDISLENFTESFFFTFFTRPRERHSATSETHVSAPFAPALKNPDKRPYMKPERNPKWNSKETLNLKRP